MASGSDPFSGTNTRNILQHIIVPKVVSDGGSGYAVKTDVINVNDLYVAGNVAAGSDNIRVGLNAGVTNQGTNAVAVGAVAGSFNQGIGAVAIGASAGYQNQGVNSVAIGTSAATINQPANSIAINATGVPLNPTASNTLFVAPIRNLGPPAPAGFYRLYYNPVTKEIAFDSNYGP